MLGWMQEKWYISHYHRNQLKHYIMDPRAPRIKELQNELDAAEETRVCLKTLKLIFRGLLTFTHDGIFICRPGGGVWGESGQTLLLPPPASVQQPSISSRLPCLHTRQHNRPESFAVLLRFFGPLPAHFEVCSAVSPVWVAGMSRRREVAKFISFLKCFKVLIMCLLQFSESVGIGGSTFQTWDKDCAFIHKPSLAADQLRYLKRQFTQKWCFNHLPSTTLEASPLVASWST